MYLNLNGILKLRKSGDLEKLFHIYMQTEGNMIGCTKKMHQSHVCDLFLETNKPWKEPKVTLVIRCRVCFQEF